MRKSVVVVAGMAALGLLGGCGKRGYDRARPDEFAVARQPPLIIPPDFALVPPQPGVARTQGNNPQAQAIDALFGGPAARSAGEAGVVDEAGGAGAATPGIRSGAGDPQTNVIDKGQTTSDIVAAPQGDGQDARAAAGGTTTAPAAQPTPKQ
ncbi:DUF3035 domain-containing protein [Sphingomonas endophytica]|uniref:DUF3035 domain-containing protein n=1 Tax=Sphingomonas endophytica TaxID=869719 RepID=A0A147I392_9SPHN|nr:DUF3035 domain-containing protein [Sphingomonas endophytica]KTT72465.1 hypothetical protein NS334_08965 [Sphingomonas endophytica]